MRSVSLNISKIGLSVGDTFKLKLVNSVGKLCTTASGYSLDEEITLTDAIFTKELLENSTIPIKTFYKITFIDTTSFLFTVPENPTSISHDMFSLLKIGCFKEILREADNIVDDSFIKKLDMYFMGNNPHFRELELSVLEMYEYYANEVEQTESTIDSMMFLDEYLSTIGAK